MQRIPEQIRELKPQLVLLRGPYDKKPVAPDASKGTSWQTCKIDDPQIKDHIDQGRNIGIVTGPVEGGELCVLDADDPEVDQAIMSSLPDTFRVKTPRGTHHHYFYSEYQYLQNLHGLDVKGTSKGYVAIPPSYARKHPPEGEPYEGPYEVANDAPIAHVKSADMEAFVARYTGEKATNTDTSRSGKDYATVCRILEESVTSRDAVYERMSKEGSSRWAEDGDDYRARTYEKAHKQIFGEAPGEGEPAKEEDIDPRFDDPALLCRVKEELDEKHVLDDREKLALFLVRLTGELPPNYRISAALKGNSSSGKDNAIKAVLSCFPEAGSFFITRGTQAALEEADNYRCIAFSEINAYREGGANAEATETFKALAEGGTSVTKKDPKTGYKTTTHIKTSQKVLFYGTTDAHADEELSTRYVVVPVRGGWEKNLAVVKHKMRAFAEADFSQDEGESWLTKGIQNLDHNLYIKIPFFDALPDDIFDYSRERIKRDAGRLFAASAAVAWIHQRQRVIHEDGERRVLMAEPCDFLAALDILEPFLNLSYSGLDPRHQDTLDMMRQLRGAHDGEIAALGFGGRYSGYVIRSKLAEALGIQSVNTIKKHIEALKDAGHIQDTFWSEEKPWVYLVKPAEEGGVKGGVKGISTPYQGGNLDTLLTGWLTGSVIGSVYKGKSPFIKPSLPFKND